MEISFRIPTIKKTYKLVYQFHVSLVGVEPLIWRRIQVPESYTFYDFHVAIQNAMGWEDRHLHMFEISDEVRIECPFAEPDLGEEIQYWTTEVPLKRHFKKVGDSYSYRYDFGDGWQHALTLEAILPREPERAYPRCLDGARACPPEDCGGPGGHLRCVEALRKRKRGDEFLRWLGDWRPEEFDARRVRFESPRKRFMDSWED